MSTRDGWGAHAIWITRTIPEAIRSRRLAFASAADIREAQERRLREMVAYARAHVPYYRETMRRLLLGPEDIATAADLARLPVLERDELQRDPEYFVSERWPIERCLRMTSSGSTDTPVVIFHDPPSLFLKAAMRERMRPLMMRLAGRRLRYSEALIVLENSSVRGQLDAYRRRSPLPVSTVQRRVLSIRRSPAELVTELDALRPDVVVSYGSYLDALFAHIRAQAPGAHLPRVAHYISDPLSPSIRSWLADECGVAVLSTYTAAEAPAIGYECECGRGYHLNVDYCPVRFVSQDGRPAAGSPAEIVISNLVNRATVLLNYRLGDVVAPLDGPCGCGRTLPMCAYLGRTKAAWLELGEGRRVHAQVLRRAVTLEPDVWRYQIVQEATRRFRIRLVASPDCQRAVLAERLSRQLRELLGGESEVEIEFVADLPRSPAGKVQPVVSLIADAAVPTA